MVGGPLGALLGAAVGHNFDQGGWKTGTASNTADAPGSVQGIFLQTAFQLMGHVAKADGRVSELEIAAARAIMDHLRLNADQRRIAIECFTAGKQPDFPIDTSLDTLKRAISNQPQLLQQLFEIQLNVAYADGSLHPRTHARLLSITDQMGVSRLQFEALHNLFRGQHYWARQQHQGNNRRAEGDRAWNHRTHGPRPTTAIHSLEQAYAVLGLKHEANPAEIKLAYRRLLKQYHPDKLASRNASPADMKRATEKTREITAAYERIREARGF